MAKDITLKSPDGTTILYPKTVQDLVLNNVTGRPLSEDAKDICFDISEFKRSGSVPATYANLASALGTNGANVPEGIRKGGMSVKYIDSTTNKYVQWRLMKKTWSTAVSDWQGVDDEPTDGSSSLVKSGGVYKQTIQVDKQEVFKKYLYSVASQSGKLLFGINTTGDVVIPSLNTHVGTRLLEDKSVTPEKIDMGDDISESQSKPVSGSLIESFVKNFSVEKSEVADKRYIYSILTNDNKLLLGIDTLGNVVIPGLTFNNALLNDFVNSLHLISDKRYVFAITDSSDRVLFGITKTGTIDSVSINYLIDYINKKMDELSVNNIDTEGSTWMDRTELLLNKADNPTKNLSESMSGEFDMADNSDFTEALVDVNGFPVYAIGKDGSVLISKLALVDGSTGTLYDVTVNNGNINLIQKS